MPRWKEPRDEQDPCLQAGSIGDTSHQDAEGGTRVAGAEGRAGRGAEGRGPGAVGGAAGRLEVSRARGALDGAARRVAVDAEAPRQDSLSRRRR
jgi:hypothetical protein